MDNTHLSITFFNKAADGEFLERALCFEKKKMKSEMKLDSEHLFELATLGIINHGEFNNFSGTT